MKKQSKITNLLVMPLIASAVFLASPAFASNNSSTLPSEVRHKTGQETHTKKHVIGTVTSVNGSIIVVTTKDNIQYTVDASTATIMKAGTEPNDNPSIITIDNIKIGDEIVVRGTVSDTEINALRIFDGKTLRKNHRHLRHHL